MRRSLPLRRSTATGMLRLRRSPLRRSLLRRSVTRTSGNGVEPALMGRNLVDNGPRSLVHTPNLRSSWRRTDGAGLEGQAVQTSAGSIAQDRRMTNSHSGELCADGTHRVLPLPQVARLVLPSCTEGFFLWFVLRKKPCAATACASGRVLPGRCRASTTACASAPAPRPAVDAGTLAACSDRLPGRVGGSPAAGRLLPAVPPPAAHA